MTPHLTPAARPAATALRAWLAAVVLLAGSALWAPAQAQTQAPGVAPSLPIKADPLEGLNRGVFAFNELVDRAPVPYTHLTLPTNRAVENWRQTEYEIKKK